MRLVLELRRLDVHDLLLSEEELGGGRGDVVQAFVGSAEAATSREALADPSAIGTSSVSIGIGVGAREVVTNGRECLIAHEEVVGAELPAVALPHLVKVVLHFPLLFLLALRLLLFIQVLALTFLEAVLILAHVLRLDHDLDVVLLLLGHVLGARSDNTLWWDEQYLLRLLTLLIHSPKAVNLPLREIAHIKSLERSIFLKTLTNRTKGSFVDALKARDTQSTDFLVLLQELPEAMQDANL